MSLSTNSADTVSRLRLVSSHHLYLGADGEWRLAGPADTFERLRMPAPLGKAVERLLSGRASHLVAATEAGGQERLDSVLRAFAERGLLVGGEGASSATDTSARSVAVLGRCDVAVRVGELFGSVGHEVVRISGGLPDPTGFDALVCCVEWLPDRAWQHLDDRCLDAGLAWHRCYRETGTYVVGPLSIPGRTASYRDTRARRLAAAKLPGELAAAWRHLDDAPPAPADADPATAAMIAGILVNDVLAFLGDRLIPTEGTQLVIDPSRMSVDRHPVLPLPAEVLPAEVLPAERAGASW